MRLEALRFPTAPAPLNKYYGSEIILVELTKFYRNYDSTTNLNEGLLCYTAPFYAIKY